VSWRRFFPFRKKEGRLSSIFDRRSPDDLRKLCQDCGVALLADDIVAPRQSQQGGQ
jgi:hypothetical protein